MSTNAQASARLEFIDAHRGIAVLLMLWMHSSDGWLIPALKRGDAWAFVRSIGGLAAPTFLLLAGVSVGLGWQGDERPGQRRAALGRGLQLIVLGYGLRLQMWMLDGGAHRHAPWAAAAVLLALGYVTAYRGLGALARAGQDTVKLLTTAAACCAAGLFTVSLAAPDRLVPLLRVDVLQAIGASCALLTLARPRLQRAPWLGLVLAAAVAAVTPWFRSWVPGPLPQPIAAYLGGWDPPPGQLAPALFPLFPWLAYGLVGASVGTTLGRRRSADRPAEVLALRLAALGLVLALLSCEALPHGHRLTTAWPLLTQPARVLFRCSVALTLGGLAVALVRLRPPGLGPLLELGRASLFVYWVHLELAFGTLSRPLAHRLGFRGWALALLGLVVLMVGLASWWRRARARLAPKPTGKPPGHDARAEPAALPSA